jgi:hypothetical protein
MQEDGVNSGARSIGRFFLFAIPLVLGLAAAVWLGVYIDAHEFNHELSQEDRAASYVGATERPKSKIAVEIQNQDCTRITRADVDGEILLLYARNDCHEREDYFAWHWQEISPNGTIIHQGYTNSCPIPGPSEVAECSMNIGDFSGESVDDRTDKIRVWTRKDTQ